MVTTGSLAKQYALKSFSHAFCMKKALLKKRFPLLGDSLPETTSAAPRYIDASLLSDF